MKETSNGMERNESYIFFTVQEDENCELEAYNYIAYNERIRIHVDFYFLNKNSFCCYGIVLILTLDM